MFIIGWIMGFGSIVVACGCHNYNAFFVCFINCLLICRIIRISSKTHINYIYTSVNGIIYGIYQTLNCKTHFIICINMRRINRQNPANLFV